MRFNHKETTIKVEDSLDQIHICKQVGIMKFTDINPFLIGRFMHRCCNGKVPEIFV